MKGKFSSLCLAALAAVTLSACSSSTNNEQVTTTTLNPEQLAGAYLVSATSWVQNAAEFRALSYQAFNVATVAFDNAKNVRGKAKAVVVDLDETMISNGDFQAGVAKYGIPFSSKNWSKWEQTGQPVALPGALEFAKHVVSKGGVVYYVSNRSEANLDYTKATLVALGFPGVTSQTVLLKGDVSSKESRFAKAQANSNVVLYVGDNLRDFPEAGKFKTKEERNAWVDANKKDFGVKYVVLPNPMYGNWMSTLVPNYYNFNLSERNQILVDSLKAWDLTNFQN
ncbi:5'-nucleotidase, lipoprotein e(P4) family [Psittacicella hinzii]|uniref:5'-nucleotidase, lipoprotein e(P4) family n=1 Tax=Psittacicella hinzii TaxID=2028575 RepID=A0A3A1Y6J3_9GAMM|nr:5'-nucleotidase, lipoprotein e(P4) family [Psittacicella hinzii]RIY32926.1 5'-nucleotidase, lipoprotein e(P4) family [Psittacicella hinzii]